MCSKLPYENPRIDKCLLDLIEDINNQGKYKTLSSCCGHDKYPITIVIKDKDNNIFEYFTMKCLKKPKRNRFYKKDVENYYYLNPELFIN